MLLPYQRKLLTTGGTDGEPESPDCRLSGVNAGVGVRLPVATGPAATPRLRPLPELFTLLMQFRDRLQISPYPAERTGQKSPQFSLRRVVPLPSFIVPEQSGQYPSQACKTQPEDNPQEDFPVACGGIACQLGYLLHWFATISLLTLAMRIKEKTGFSLQRARSWTLPVFLALPRNLGQGDCASGTLPRSAENPHPPGTTELSAMYIMPVGPIAGEL